MENNEQIEETQDTSTEDVNNEEQTQEGQEETKDWKAEALKYKAIAERKDKKLQDKPQVEETKKTNTEQNAPTMEHMALFGKGATLEEVKIAENVAKIEGKTLTEAYDSDYAQNKFATMRQDAQVKANTLPASGGSAAAPREKTVKNMDEKEHEEYGTALLKNATHR